MFCCCCVAVVVVVFSLFSFFLLLIFRVWENEKNDSNFNFPSAIQYVCVSVCVFIYTHSHCIYRLHHYRKVFFDYDAGAAVAATDAIASDVGYHCHCGSC